MASHWNAPQYGHQTGVHEQAILNTINEHEREKGELHKQMADLRHQHATAVSQMENHRRAAETHRERRDGAEAEIASLNDVLSQLQIEHAKCGRKLAQLDLENNQLLNRNEDKDKRIKEASQKYDTLHAQMTEKEIRDILKKYDYLLQGHDGRTYNTPMERDLKLRKHERQFMTTKQ